MGRREDKKGNGSIQALFKPLYWPYKFLERRKKLVKPIPGILITVEKSNYGVAFIYCPYVIYRRCSRLFGGKN